MIAICLGGLGSGYLYSALADVRPVVKLNRTVFRGEVLQASDLGVVTLTGAAQVQTVDARKVPELLGKSAVTDLPAGSLLAAASVGNPEIPPGTARVGLRLDAGRLPSTPLPAGTPILLVEVPRPGQADVPLVGKSSVTARIAAAPTVKSSGEALLDVAVPLAEAERVTRLAALDQVSIVRVAGA